MKLYVNERSGNACIDNIKAPPGYIAVVREKAVVMGPIIVAVPLFPGKKPGWGI